jgi:hAT family C-terminal dimerisation region
MNSKILGIKRKLEFYVTKIKTGDLSCFPVLRSQLEESGRSSLQPKLQELFVEHLKKLRDEFYKYFPQDEVDHVWILNPFVFDTSNLPIELTSTAQEQLLTLSSNVVLATKFKTMSLTEFWISVRPEYTELMDVAATVLLKFSTSYLCEKAFSAMLVLKNKYRNRLEVENDLRIFSNELLYVKNNVSTSYFGLSRLGKRAPVINIFSMQTLYLNISGLIGGIKVKATGFLASATRFFF